MRFGAHDPPGAPSVISFVAPEMLSVPLKVEPHARNTPPRLTDTGPVTVELTNETLAPAGTFNVPLIVAPCTQVVPLACTAPTEPMTVVEQGTVRVSVGAVDPLKFPSPV